uniref:Uncharacterized protein n=1 Tax=Timema tahoe TaxID=61484 RepID=A0A7R9INQ7_9NEOP|nr:unnamed protein product [Timema tahoe]
MDDITIHYHRTVTPFGTATPNHGAGSHPDRGTGGRERDIKLVQEPARPRIHIQARIIPLLRAEYSNSCSPVQQQLLTTAMDVEFTIATSPIHWFGQFTELVQGTELHESLMTWRQCRIRMREGGPDTWLTRCPSLVWKSPVNEGGARRICALFPGRSCSPMFLTVPDVYFCRHPSPSVDKERPEPPTLAVTCCHVTIDPVSPKYPFRLYLSRF